MKLKPRRLGIIIRHGESASCYYIFDASAPAGEQPAILTTFPTLAEANRFIERVHASVVSTEEIEKLLNEYAELAVAQGYSPIPSYFKPGPGKFEGESVATFWFFHASMDGCGEDLTTEAESNWGASAVRLPVSPAERIVFDLPRRRSVIVYESSDGFVSLS